MIALTGTDKQIAWADKIRSAALDILASGKGAALVALAEKQTAASWWIEHRLLLEHQPNIATTLLQGAGYMDRDRRPTDAGKAWLASRAAG